MTYDRTSRWAPSGSAATPELQAAATNTMSGVFPRHSTRVFKETLTVITLALAFVLVVLAVTVLAPRSAWPQTTMDPAAAAQDPWPAGLFFRSGRSDALLEAPSLKSDVVIRINGEWSPEPMSASASSTRPTSGSRGSMYSRCPRAPRSTAWSWRSASAASRAASCRRRKRKRSSSRRPPRVAKPACWRASGPTSS